MNSSHEVTLRVSLFCRRGMSPSIQTDLNSGDMLHGQNVIPATRFFMKIKCSRDGICRGDLQHVPLCVPTLNLKQL